MAITPVTAPLPAENLEPWIEARNELDQQLKSTANAAAALADANQAALGLKANSSTVTAGLATKIDNTEKGANSGVATLDAQGKLVASQLPALAITEFKGSVATQAAMLAVTGEQGDWVVRTDRGTVFIITGTPTVVGGWTEMAYPTAPVLSVNGKTGAVSLVPLDIGAAAAADLNNVDTKANDAIAAAAAAQSTANGRATVASVTAASNAAAAAQAKADAAIPSSQLVTTVGVRGVLHGAIIPKNGTAPVDSVPLDLIIEKNA